MKAFVYLSRICALVVGFYMQGCYSGDQCTGKYGSVSRTKYCDIGGCCIPGTIDEYTNPDDLCCIATLTAILVGSFVGGPIAILLLVCAGVAIKRCYDKHKKPERISESRQERRRERRRQHEQQMREEEALRIRRYYNPEPENQPVGPPAYAGKPPEYNNNTAGMPGAVDLPKSPPPAYEVILQEATISRQPTDDNQTSPANSSQPTTNYIDTTIQAPSIHGRSPRRVRKLQHTNSENRAHTSHQRASSINRVSPQNIPSRNKEDNDHITPSFSRPHQVITDASVEEPDLIYI